jgi:hypothetical protein
LKPCRLLRRLSITQDITVNQLRELDEKAKREQCNGTEKLAWSNDVDPEVGILPDFIKPLTRYAPFEKLHEKKRSVICTTARWQIGKSNRPFATTDNFLSVNLTVSRAPAPLSGRRSREDSPQQAQRRCWAVGSARGWASKEQMRGRTEEGRGHDRRKGDIRGQRPLLRIALENPSLR